MKKYIKKLNEILHEAQQEFNQVKTTRSLLETQKKYLGKKSSLTKILRSLQNIPQADRPQVGTKANKLKQLIEEKYKDVQNRIKNKECLEIDTALDATIPGKEVHLGHIHPITQMCWEIENIFQNMGFELIEPFDVDDDYHNFESLNMPRDHPARDIWDTFWTEDGYIPITHTSSMQNRIFKARKPPIRTICIGKVFRNERTDARHEHTLYQCAGIYVDKGITLCDMIGTLKTFFSNFYETEIKMRLAPKFLPFVEPGNAINLGCMICNMKGCSVCKYTGWLEVLGCGMIHPLVLQEGGIDPDVYSGFAWEFGVDRLVMLKYGIEDVRNFHQGDLKFIKQF